MVVRIWYSGEVQQYVARQGDIWVDETREHGEYYVH